MSRKGVTFIRGGHAPTLPEYRERGSKVLATIERYALEDRTPVALVDSSKRQSDNLRLTGKFPFLLPYMMLLLLASCVSQDWDDVATDT